ncbi:MAG: VWA domain-containing protein [Chloroflexia bacterium]|nr:VWA domain-containing protein [Chloroflexia bacterium]
MLNANANGKGTIDVSRVRSRRVAGNLLRFGRRLRSAGMPVGSGNILGLIEAIDAVGIRRRDDVYSAAKATLVTRPEQVPMFNAEFLRFWADLVDQQAPMFSEAIHDDEETVGMPNPIQRKEKGEQGQGAKGGEVDKTVLAVEGTEDIEDLGETEDYEIPPEDVLIFSASEALRKKDFSQFSPDELAEARRLIESMTWRLGTRLTRRRKRAINGAYIDYRATLRGAMKQGGVPLDLKWRERKERMRPLVLICDISGSMDRYSRLLLRFVHALEHGLDSVEVFVFGTRLTRITRELRKKNVDVAIADVVASVDDWSGGTRIGESIKNFNYKWSRRVLRSGATVVVISDGWDRGDPELLGAEMARLQRSCRRVIWLNPLLGAPGYQPLTQGIRASLPYVDHFLPIHNLKSLEALAKLLGAVEDTPPVRRQVSSRAIRAS